MEIFDQIGILFHRFDGFDCGSRGSWTKPSFATGTVTGRGFPSQRADIEGSSNSIWRVNETFLWVLLFLVSRNGCFRKWWYPQIIHFNRVFHYFHHPFWGTPIFGNTQIAHEIHWQDVNVDGPMFFDGLQEAARFRWQSSVAVPALPKKAMPVNVPKQAMPTDPLLWCDHPSSDHHIPRADSPAILVTWCPTGENIITWNGDRPTAWWKK